MPFIGNQPALAYTSFAKQDFTTSATTSYTLDNPVANANEIALFINFVRQEPTTAYTASGTSLTLTSATSASDDMYCVFLGKAVQTVNPPAGSVGLSQLSATGTKDATTFLRGDNTFQTIGTNTPSFQLQNGTPQTIANGSFTKMTFDTENWDTDNAVSSNTFTVPSGKAGKYWFQNTVEIGGIDTGEFVNIMIYVNGSNTATARWYSSGADDDIRAKVQAVLDLSEGDTVEAYVYHNEGASRDTKGGAESNKFTGYRLIGV